tara:strand:- start:2181 stop:3395 length:1215 start_codon:yes stop_codon:yes gene_type:complete
MKFKVIVLNFTLFCTASFIPLLAYSFIEEFMSIKQHDMQVPYFKELKRQIDIDYPLKINSVKGGYLPTFYPAETLRYFYSSKFYPLGTLPNTNSYLCNEGYGLVTYKSDRFGLRNKDQNWDKISKVGATFFIGDSYTHGACVDDEYTFPQVFERLNGANTINLGAGNNGPNEYIANLKGLVKPIVSKIKRQKFNVVLVFYDNDNVGYNQDVIKHLSVIKPIPVFTKKGKVNPSKQYNLTIKRIINKNYPTEEEGILNKLELNKNKLLNPNKKMGFLYKVLSLWPLRRRIINLERFRGLHDDYSKSSTSLDAISELNDICNVNLLCTPYVAYIPNSDYWRPNQARDLYKLHLQKSSNKLKIKFIDGSTVIDSRDVDDFAPIGPHLSKLGYQKIAELISSHLSKKN